MRRSGWVWVALTVLVVACGQAGGRVVLTAEDTGSTVLLNSGDQLELRLESNASTGFQWVLPNEGKPAGLELAESRYEDPGTDLVGAPGTQVFVFAARGTGAGVLRVEYLRPFEEPVIPERVVEYIVQIDGAPWPPLDRGTPPGTSTGSLP